MAATGGPMGPQVGERPRETYERDVRAAPIPGDERLLEPPFHDVYDDEGLRPLLVLAESLRLSPSRELLVHC